MTDQTAARSAKEQKLKEAYFTASQRQLIWQRFKKNKSALIGAWVLVILILSGLFSPFLTPYDPTINGRDKDYMNGAPQIPQFCDDNGCSLRPFIYTYERTRSIQTNFRWVTEEKNGLEDRRYVQFFVQGSPYTLFGIPMDTHLFGVDKGQIHIFGTDSTGKDIYSRTLKAINTSMAVGTIGVFIAFIMALIIGGVAGYYGGWIDSILQMITDTVRTIPSIPLFMALA
ncbi:MAG TPA: ABC transporter permease, partial [Aliiroseovarius sp.]|nr:ABC transporter permease [Aliiroseovarius sp.]